MNCKDVQLTILDQANDLPAPVREHLAHCPVCRSFADTHDHVLDATLTAEPSAELDNAVLRAARDRIAATPLAVVDLGKDLDQRPLSFRRSRRTARPSLYGQRLALAASLMLAAMAFALYFLSLQLSDKAGQLADAQQDPNVQAAYVQFLPDWPDHELDADLLDLAVELALSELVTGQPATAGGTGQLPAAGLTPGTTLGDALLEFELDLYLENGDSWLDVRRNDGA